MHTNQHNNRPVLQIRDLSVRFRAFALEDINLDVMQGDYLALLGVSGAGKTVLLEALAGLVRPAKGSILLNGRDITRNKVQGRGVGLVYQDLSLFPHLNVWKNIAYPLRNKPLSAADRKIQVKKLARQVEVSHLLERYPGTLSGGEAQRVALARTLASDPRILLLDEPLSNLDVKLKGELRRVLRNIHRSGKTMIHVTHDFMEAATLANKVSVVENGRLVQHGTPEEVFRHPRNEFVARFSGIKNLFPCKSVTRGDSDGLHKAALNDQVSIHYLGKDGNLCGYVMIPQEDIIVSEKPIESSAINRLEGVVSEAYMSGSGMELVVDAGVPFVVSVSRQSHQNLDLQPGKKVWLSFKASAVRFMES